MEELSGVSPLPLRPTADGIKAPDYGDSSAEVVQNHHKQLSGSADIAEVANKLREMVSDVNCVSGKDYF